MDGWFVPMRAREFRAHMREGPITREFGRLWRAMFLSSLGDWVGIVALAALVARLGGSRDGAYAVAGVMAARLAAVVLVGPVAGVLADRIDRRTLLVVADLVRASLFVALPFVDAIWAIGVFAFVVEACSLVWSPARDASVPSMVGGEALARANGIIIATTYGLLPLGAVVFTALAAVSAAAGAPASAHPEALALWFDALTFVGSALIVSRLALGGDRHVKAPGIRGGFDDAREGIRFLRARRQLLALVAVLVLAFATAGAVTGIGPLFTRYTLDSGDTGFGVLVVGFGVGLMASALCVMQQAARLELAHVFTVGTTASAVGLLALALAPAMPWAICACIALGLAGGLAWVSGYTLVQQMVTDEFRGRTLGLLTTGSRMSLLVSRALFPLLAGVVGTVAVSSGVEVTGNRVALLAGAALLGIAAIVARRAVAAPDDG
jgi:dTMP kinase